MTTRQLTSEATSAELTDWDRFVLRHRHPGNLVFHFISFLFFFGSPVLAWIFHSYWLLVPFFISGIVGAAGHWLFGDGGVNVRETTSSPQVVMFNTLMLYKIATGAYGRDVRAALSKVSG